MAIIIHELLWIEYVVDKLSWKHGLTCHEVEEALISKSKCRIFKKENGHVEGEDLYNALSKTKDGRYLSIFFILKAKNKALIVTARDMTGTERRRYEKK